jgi:hypothetical protein
MRNEKWAKSNEQWGMGKKKKEAQGCTVVPGSAFNPRERGFREWGMSKEQRAMGNEE